MQHVDYSLQGNVAVLALSRPPVNSLGHSLRRELLKVTAAGSRPVVAAIEGVALGGGMGAAGLFEVA